MRNMLLLCLVLLPACGLDLPCDNVAHVVNLSAKPNVKGCWKVVPQEGGGVSAAEQGLCSEVASCLVVGADADFYTYSIAQEKYDAYDWDCSEPCNGSN